MPAAKRRAGEIDQKPQYLTINLPAPAGADDYSVVIVQTPFTALVAPVGMATVMEILKVDWYIGMLDALDAQSTHWGFLATNTNRLGNATSTLITEDQDRAQATTFGMVARHANFTTSGASNRLSPMSVDMTDGNGNGIIYAAAQFVAVTGAVANTAASGATCKMLYRLSFVNTEEYLGYLASQTIPILVSTAP